MGSSWLRGARWTTAFDVELFDAGIAVPLSFGSRFELRPWGGVNGTNSSKVTVMMFGLDLGLRATIARWIALESGWRYRDWNYDRGPGSYDGPYVRIALAF